MVAWHCTGPGVPDLRSAFLARSFDLGGSERQLLSLARGLVRRDHDVLVVVVEAGGALVPELRAAGATVVEVTEGGVGRLPLHLGRLVGPLRRFRPDTVHGFLAFSNTLAVLCHAFLPGTHVVQGIRMIEPDRDADRPLVRAFYRVEALSSRFADAIISNSESGRGHALARGFPADRLHVIPNGIDTEAFRFDSTARKQLRSEWSVADDEVLIGRIGQIRPTKDYPCFLRAAATAAKNRPDLRFVVVGEGPDRDALLALAQGLGLEPRLIWAGERRDVVAVMSALDVMVSSSKSESFPNVVGEAMACGVPCAVTDTGDSAEIVGPTGTVAPPGSPDLLAAAVLELADRVVRDGPQVGAQARARIEDRYTLEAMVARTERILLDLIEPRRRQQRP